MINFAARVMGLADRNQILFTSDAYRQIIDMVDDPNLVDRFREFREIRIKHDIQIEAYQYLGEGEPYISSDPPENLAYMQRSKKAMEALSSAGFPMPTPESMFDKKEQALKMMEEMATAFSGLESPPKRAVQAQKETDQ